MSLLRIRGVTKGFGGLAALASVDLDVREGETVGLIGPNGAGKTTLINAITGVHPPDRGSIALDGHELTRLSPPRITRLGIARTFQIPQPFSGLTTLENVMVGVAFGGHAAALGEAARRARELLAFVGLGDKAAASPQSLSIVELRKLELARALGSGARLLLLDEIHAGLTPAEMSQAIALIERLHAQGVAIVMVEHLMRIIMTVCQRVVVLHLGTKIAEGTPAEIARNPDVVRAYLGERHAGARTGDAAG